MTIFGVCPRNLICIYSGRKMTPSLSYVTVRGEGKMEKTGGGGQDGKASVSMFSVTENISFPRFNFDTIGGILIRYFCTIVCFVNQRNHKTLAMQAHALTRTRYFYSLNVVISHLIVYKEGLSYLSVCAIASRSSPPSHVCICNGHPSSELFCVHCKSGKVLMWLNMPMDGQTYMASPLCVHFMYFVQRTHNNVSIACFVCSESIEWHAICNFVLRHQRLIRLQVGPGCHTISCL
jgi:hypothetical protein